MIEAAQSQLAPLEHLATGVPGLDTVLCGGILPGGVYILQGGPGTGKTILANQICYNWAATGKRSLYVTLLAETHHRLLRYLRNMQFFHAEHAADAVFYESGFDTLKTEGLEGILAFLRRNSRARDASLMVLDGLFVLEETAESERIFREFINDIAVLADLAGCAILLLTNSKRSSASPEYTMVDGWIELDMVENEYRSLRHIRVHKFRGSDFVGGRHASNISWRGFHVFPRLETLPLPPVTTKDLVRRISSGVPSLDGVIAGGLPIASATLLVGPTGTGKTTLGLHFICESSASEPGLILGFYEDAVRLRRRAETMNLPLAERLDSGMVSLQWQPATEIVLDELIDELLSEIRRKGIKRLLIDGIAALERAVLYESRHSRFMAALTDTLRNLGVTTVYTAELPQLIGSPYNVRVGTVSAVAENVILMRYAELESRLAKVLSVMKMRDSQFSPDVHEVKIDNRGLVLKNRLTSGDDALLDNGPKPGRPSDA